LLAALATALLYAAFTDLRRRQIENWLNAAIALGAPLFWYANGLTLEQAGWQVALAIVTFAGLSVIFFLRGMGGGDVKLLTALALWIVPLTFLKLFVMMSLIGGAMSVAAAARNMEPRDGEWFATFLARSAAVLWVGFSAYAIYRLSVRRPLPLNDILQADLSSGLAKILAWSLGAVFLLTMITGIFVIVRRQRKRLPIPYGVAISLAGLWVLASQYFPEISNGARLG
jgi:prepilin peptidase CpaA